MATLFGTAKYANGQDAGSSNRISTDWSSNTCAPSDGRYALNLGGDNPCKTITVYANGNTVGTVYVDGNTSFDVVIR